MIRVLLLAPNRIYAASNSTQDFVRRSIVMDFRVRFVQEA